MKISHRQFQWFQNFRGIRASDISTNRGRNIGSRGVARFEESARSGSASTIEVNLEETAGSSSFARKLQGMADETLPVLAKELLA